MMSIINFFRNCDVHKLLRRLDVLIKTRPSTVLEDVSESEICQYLSCLVECYFMCSESIKLSRAIEKVMFSMLCVRKGTFVDLEGVRRGSLVPPPCLQFLNIP